MRLPRKHLIDGVVQDVVKFNLNKWFGNLYKIIILTVYTNHLWSHYIHRLSVHLSQHHADSSCEYTYFDAVFTQDNAGASHHICSMSKYLLGFHSTCLTIIKAVTFHSYYQGEHKIHFFFLCVKVSLLCRNRYGQSLFHLEICCSLIANSFSAFVGVNEMQHCKAYFMNMEDLHVHSCSLFCLYYTHAYTHSSILRSMTGNQMTPHWLMCWTITISCLYDMTFFMVKLLSYWAL